MKTKRAEKQKGITLIALVITIIVLLILAGVAISMLSGENGILKQAAKAKTETEEKSTVEAMKLAGITALTAGNGSVDNDNYYVALNKELKDLDYDGTISKGDLPVKDIVVKGLHFAIKEKGEVVNLAWWYIEDATKITNGKQTLTIGDTVKYDPTEGVTEDKEYTPTKVSSTAFKLSVTDDTIKANQKLTWKVLGTDEDGNVLIMPTDDIKKADSGSIANQTLSMGGRRAAQYGAEEVNKIASIYGYGKGAIGARSVQVEDINKVTGYNPNNIGVRDVNQIGTGTKYGSDTYLYGNKVTYKLNSNGKIEYSYSGKAAQESSYTSFQNVDGSTLKTGESKTLTSSIYCYYPTTLTETNNTSATTGLGTSSPVYKMIFRNADDTSNTSYWLGSSYVRTNTGTVSGTAAFGVRGVSGGGVDYCGMFGSNGIAGSWNVGVRPAVSLKSDITFGGDATSGWTIQ